MRPCTLMTTLAVTLCALSSTTMATPPNEPAVLGEAPERKLPIVASQSTPVRDVHIAFSGGGFFSHSVLSGFVSGIIDHQLGGLENPDYETQLEQLFGRTKTITSNSGGSWFMSQLAYSPTFQANFEATRLDWGNTGYLGLAELYMGVAGCPLDGYVFGGDAICNNFGNNIAMLAYFGMNWERLVREGVHAPWGMSDELGSKSLRSDPAYQASIRNRWARDINLSYASTISVTESFLNCNAPDGASTYIAKGAGTHSKIYVTHPYEIGMLDYANEPVHISSWVSPGTRPRFSKKDLQLTYRFGHGPFGGNSFTSDPVDKFLEIDVSPLIASTASSSAMGFMPSINNFRTMTGCDVFSFAAEQLVGEIMFQSDVDFQIDESTGTPTLKAFPSSQHDADMNSSELAAARRFSLFDGSFSDDLGVVQLLHGLTDRGELDPANPANQEPLKILIIETNAKKIWSEYKFDGVNTGLLMPANIQKLFTTGTAADVLPQDNSGVEHMPAVVFDRPVAGSHAVDSSGFVAAWTTALDRPDFSLGDEECLVLLSSFKTSTLAFQPVHPISGQREVEILTLAVFGSDELAEPDLQGIEAVLLPSNPEAWDYLHFCYTTVRKAMSQPGFAPLMEFLGDECPGDPNKWFAGDCGCGVPEGGDTDADGTPDCVDPCPLVPFDCVPGTEFVLAGESIQAAMDSLPDGGDITLGPGVHTISDTLDFKGKSINIYGASYVDDRMEPSILSSTNPDGGAFLIEGVALANLGGLTIQGFTSSTAGVVTVRNSLAQFTRVRFLDNTGSIGGALHVENTPAHGPVVATDCEFTNNHATTVGGAIYADSPPNAVGNHGLVLSRAIIHDNTDPGNIGGILLTSSSKAILIDTIVCGNTGGQVSGGETELAGNTCVSACCEDADGDGAFDGCDPAGEQDSDADGIMDCLDPCPAWSYECDDDARLTVAIGDPIQLAIDTVADGGSITLAPGVHTVSETLRINDKRVTITGTVNPDLQDPSATVIEGAVSDGPILSVENQLYDPDTHHGITLLDLEFRNAQANAVWIKNAWGDIRRVRFIDNIGHALYVQNNVPWELYRVVVHDCSFTGNHASWGGGAMFVAAPPDSQFPRMFIYRSVMQGNRANDGSALYLTSDSEVFMRGSLVCGNSSDTGGPQINRPDLVTLDGEDNCIGEFCVDADGDGVADGCCDYGSLDSDDDGTPDCADPCPDWPNDCDSPDLLVVDTDESIQQAIDALPSQGALVLSGGVHSIDQPLLIDAPVNIYGSAYLDPSAAPTILDAAGSNDGAIRITDIDSGPVNIGGLTIQNASATEGGAILIRNSETLLADLVFVDNTADRGGALFISNENPDRPVYVTDCRFTGNSASEDGGAVYASGPLDTELNAIGLFHCLIHGNAASRDGSGVFITAESGPTAVAISNTIACGNAGPGNQVDGPYAAEFEANCISEYCLDSDDDGIIDGCTDIECIGDINGDGQVNGFDLGLLLAAWTGNNDCASESCLAADFNGDGRVDGFDMGLFLAAWGNDCTGN